MTQIARAFSPPQRGEGGRRPDEGRGPAIRRSFVAFAALLLISLAFASHVAALAIPPRPAAWVTDNAGLLTSAQAQALNEKCESFYRAGKAQLAIMTFPSLEGEDPLDYTNRVVNQWKTKGDRIAIIFVFSKEKKVQIQVGYGLEGDLTDAFSSDVISNTIAPTFREGRYYDGLDAAIDRMAKKIDPSWTPPASATAASPSTGVSSRPLHPIRERSPGFAATDVIFLIVILAIMFFVVLPMMRRGGCGGCIGCFPFFPFGGGGWGGGGSTFGGGGGGGWSIGSNWGGGGGGSSFGGGGAGGGW